MSACSGLHAIRQTRNSIGIGILGLKRRFHDHRTEVPVHDQHVRTEPVVGFRQRTQLFGLDNRLYTGGCLLLGVCALQCRA